MNIKDILKKVVEKQALTDEEVKALQEFDGEAATRTAVDAAAAAARRDAEAKLKKAMDDLKAEADAKAELQAKVLEYETNVKKKGGADNEALRLLNEKLEKMEKDLTAEREAKTKLARESRIGSIIQKAGIKYVDGVDVTEVTASLFRKLAALDDEAIASIEKADAPHKDLANGHIFSKHKEAWKAVIADDTGNGSGQRPGQPGAFRSTGKNPWKKETKNLTDQIHLMNSDPQKAAQLMAEAGVKPAQE